jgi:xylulokinase
MSIMGVDVGTTGTKAVIFDESGAIITSHYIEYPLQTPAPDQCELNPHEVWTAVKHTMSTAAAESAPADPVKAIGISTLGDSLTLLDKKGEALSNTLVGAADRRAVPQIEKLLQSYDRASLFEMTGEPLSAASVIPKILWFRDNKPDIYEKTSKFSGWQEIVHQRLGLEPSIDYSLASRTMLMDVRKRDWATELLHSCGLSPAQFHSLTPSHHVVGTLDTSIAETLGLQKGTPVVAGGFDQCCCALGSGVLSEGQAANTVGTLEGIIVISESLRLKPTLLEGFYGCGIYVTGDSFFSLGYVTTSGGVLRWYRNILGKDEVEQARRRNSDPYGIIIGSAEDKPAPLYVLPSFAGSGTPWLDEREKGSIFGLTLSTEKRDIVKGILDGICYEVRLNLETLSSAGIAIESLRATGGGTRSDSWMQLKADITGLPVEVTDVTEAGCLGAAFLGGLGAGLYNDPRDIHSLVKVARVFEPRPRFQTLYNGHYETYMHLKKTVRGLAL